MAEEKSPFDNIDKEFTLVNRPFEPELGDDIEVELPTETVVNEDGSVDVGPEDAVKPEMGFGSNLVQALSEDELAGISSMVLEKVDEDKSEMPKFNIQLNHVQRNSENQNQQEEINPFQVNLKDRAIYNLIWSLACFQKRF